jgi:hypothetical protein
LLWLRSSRPRNPLPSASAAQLGRLMAMTDRNRDALRGIPAVIAPYHAFTRALDARARAAGNHFWERGNPHHGLAPLVESRLRDTLKVLLGAGDAPDSSWLSRRDIWGDGFNAFDVLHHKIQIPLVERLRDCVDGAHVGFSVTLYAYEDDFGQGEPCSGALWIDHAETLVTPSLAGALRIAI